MEIYHQKFIKSSLKNPIMENDILNILNEFDWDKLEKEKIAYKKDFIELEKSFKFSSSSGLVLMRKIIENIIKRLYFSQIQKNPPNFYKMVIELKNNKIIPPQISNQINYIRTSGNESAHKNVTSEDVQEEVILSQLTPVFITTVSWLLSKTVNKIIKEKQQTEIEDLNQVEAYDENFYIFSQELTFLNEINKFFEYNNIPVSSPYNDSIDFNVKVDAGHIIEINIWDEENTLPYLHDSIGNLKYLQEIKIEHNQIKSVPSSIGALNLLTSMNFFDCKIQTLPDSIGELINLTNLYLSKNQLKTLPDSIGELKNLTILDLSENRLEFLPDSICKLKSLLLFCIDNNKIKELPQTIGEMQSLIKLDMNHNKLEIIPNTIGNLKEIRIIDFGYNQISEFPQFTKEKSKLGYLNLENNKITIIPESFENLKNLIYLDLGDNELNSISASIGKLKNLEKLFLWGNNNIELPSSIIQLKNLTRFYLTDDIDKKFSENTEIMLKKLEKKGCKIYRGGSSLKYEQDIFPKIKFYGSSFSCPYCNKTEYGEPIDHFKTCKNTPMEVIAAIRNYLNKKNKDS